MPRISVIVPIYKVEPYLRRCVDSILAQTFTDFELILVDDGSPDNCGSICDEYAAQDSRVQVIHQKNGGLSAARNAGLDWVFANSESEWITFVDSDDWVHSAYLETLYRAVTEHEVSIGMCEAKHMKEYSMEEASGIGVSMMLTAEEAYVSRYGMAMMAWGKLYHRCCWEQSRFPIGRIHEDAFTVYRLLFACEKVAVCDTPFYYYYYNQEGITHSKWTTRRLDEVEAHEQQLAFLKHDYPAAYRREAEAYVCVLTNQLIQMQKCTGDYQTLENELHAKLRRALKEYRKTCSKRIEGKEWIYETAFPFEMKLYWYAKAIARRVSVRKN